MKNKWMELLKKREIQKPIVVLGLSALVVIAEILRELQGFRIRHYNITSDKIQKPMRLVFLSDLHGKVYGKNHKDLLRAVRSQKPDVILVGGDILTRGHEWTDADAYDMMKQLIQIAPVYAANGNHEQKMKESPEYFENRYEAYKEALLEAGIIILENESAKMNVNGNEVSVTGLEIPSECYAHFKTIPLPTEAIEERIGGCEENVYQILLAHNPAYMDDYKKWGADLTLSGHLHGGIIRLPFLGGVITPQVKFFPRYSGDMYQDGNHVGVVSRGLGTHTVNLRYLNMAELVSIDLRPHNKI